METKVRITGRQWCAVVACFMLAGFVQGCTRSAYMEWRTPDRIVLENKVVLDGDG